MIYNTPIEKYLIEGQEIYVKREDLACLPPGPPFAKVRGLYPVLRRLKKEGIKTVGYMETSISMAGWGISYFCKNLGMKAVIFMPQYKDGLRYNQEFQINKWEKFGAEIIPIEKPSRMFINFYRARKILSEKYPSSMMLPQGMPFEETVREVSIQASHISSYYKSIICCIGSGAMIAGILHARLGIPIYGILVSKKGTKIVKEKVLRMSGMDGFIRKYLFIIDYGYEYTDLEEIECPFPCNPYYDRKAWKWLMGNMDKVEKPILFWNIGA
ncbi:PLP-dependent lyase/thiolase [Patescibacteria group bacterium]|uniref:Tryptophan synthase beta chain-like PALP domain-containing protein n=1 Tax=viral metagenome TaxID=1070528 RepID=A0A6M3MCN9_9ZZZZ|nr:PLP-dependent lyase/thiolase [Patescibacteria group bacterium]MBU0847214.1 PLP-dependent lyase/thiolase [Patescibacteria group bacterium]